MVSLKPGVAGCKVSGGLGLQENVPVEGQDTPAALIGMSTARKLTLPGDPGVAQVATLASSRLSLRSMTLPTIEPAFAIPPDPSMKGETDDAQLAFSEEGCVGSQLGTAHGFTELT
jgi:hypothetical protein